MRLIFGGLLAGQFDRFIVLWFYRCICMSDIEVEKDEVLAVKRVANKILEKEADSDHVSAIESGVEALESAVDGEVPEVDEEPSESDVDTALEVLEREGEEYGGLDDEYDERNEIRGLHEFVERESMHVNGSLESSRKWEAVYLKPGSMMRDYDEEDVLVREEHDHWDEIDIRPEIDGHQYGHARNRREDGTKRLILLEEEPDDWHKERMGI